MGEKQDKPQKKVKPPPKVLDPKLAKTVEFGEKPRNKKAHRFGR